MIRIKYAIDAYVSSVAFILFVFAENIELVLFWIATGIWYAYSAFSIRTWIIDFGWFLSKIDRESNEIIHKILLPNQLAYYCIINYVFAGHTVWSFTGACLYINNSIVEAPPLLGFAILA